MSVERNSGAGKPGKNLFQRVRENVMAENGTGGDTIAGRVSAVLRPAAMDAFARVRKRFSVQEQPTKVTTQVSESETIASQGNSTSEGLISGTSTDSTPNTWRSNAKKAAIIGGIGAAAVFVAKSLYSDDETGKVDRKKLGKSLGKAVAIGAVEGIAGVAGITMRHHRELTHRSLKLSERLQKAIDFEQRSLGIPETYTWASVHRIHHEMEDANLEPAYRIYHAAKEAEARGIDIPESYLGLDPFVEEMGRETVLQIGEAADTLVRDRLKDLYRPPQFADDAEVIATLNPTEPQYYYEPRIKREARDDYTPDDLARYLLRDPHSPALVRRDNPVQGVAIENMPLYQEPANAFRQFPEIKPKDLQRPEDFDPEYQPKVAKDVVAGFAINTAIMAAANRDFSVAGAARAVLEGSAANGVRAGLEFLGGNVTNSAGHMGDPFQSELAQAFFNRKYVIKLKSDGTISTNTVGAGRGPASRVLGRMASWATLDEVGGQQIHHQEPWKIAYTNAEGIEAVVEAPWGSMLEFLAESNAVQDIKKGDNFIGQTRPDVAHPAVKLIQSLRAERYKIDHPSGEPVEPVPQSGGLSRLGRRISGLVTQNRK